MMRVGKDVEDSVEWRLVGVVGAGVKGVQEVKCVRHLYRGESLRDCPSVRNLLMVPSRVKG